MKAIRYNTNGGSFGCRGSECIPLKEQMTFDGWHSDGYRYNAKWRPVEFKSLSNGSGFCPGVSETCKDMDKGLTRPDAPVEIVLQKGRYGENVYTLKTVYTDIAVDGVKDPAYDYGLHVSSRFTTNDELYENKPTKFDASLIRGQDGRIYCFIEAVDTEILVPREHWDGRWTHWRTDCIQFYFDIDNTRNNPAATFTFAANGEAKQFIKGECDYNIEYKVVLTDVGYNVEFAFNNGGAPFLDGDRMGFDIFMNDLSRFVSPSDYTKHSLTIAHALCGDKYHSPNATLCDTIKFSSQSATGRVDTERMGGIEKTGDIIADIMSGACSVAVVASKSISAYSQNGIKSLSAVLKSYNGRVVVTDDAEDHGCDCEILVGLTNRPESRALAEKIPYNGYALEIRDGRICLIGWLEDAFDKASGMLKSALAYVMGGGKTSDLSPLYSGVIDGVPENIPTMPNLTTVTDAGGGAYLVLSKNSTEAAFNEYVDSLKAAGFEIVVENRLVDTLCKTLVTDEVIVNVTFGGAGDPHLRAVVENRAYTDLPIVETAPYKKVSASKIIQVAPNYMCYLIKLDNGEFIAVDSGNNGVEQPIYDHLMKNSEDGHPVIAAWFFSHFHQDHIGGFIDFANNDEYMKNVTVKSVVYNFPEDQVILTARGSWQDMDNIRDWPERLARIGCTPIRARTGQKFIFGNAEIDMIYTYEDLMPFYVHHDDTNPTSSVISVKIEGQRLIITGDCCGEATKLMVEKYGDWLKTDFVQLPHHGWGSGGTDIRFYELCDAPWVLYPGDSFAPSSSERWACEHSKRYFLRERTTLTIPLPYNDEEPQKD